ncbi:MAG: calcium-binding protein, partial [Pseudomonadota bacterium]
MARRTGDSGPNSLFGTNKKDLIRGLGGIDRLQGNGGNDTIIGLGEVDGGAGNDRWFSINVVRKHDPGFVTTSQTDVDMDAGADRVFIHDHQGNWPFTQGTLHFQVEMGTGNDRATMTSTRFGASLDLGEGRDTARILTENGVQVRLGGPDFGLGGDGDRDVVHVSAHGENVTIFQFDRNDKLVIHGTDLSDRQLAQRTSDTFGTNLAQTITLETGREITIFKEWTGKLGKARLDGVKKNLVIKEKVHIEDQAKAEDAVFGSGADDNLRVRKGEVLFLGGGDDRGRGSGRKDELHGEAGNDRLDGAGGADRLEGGTGDDRLLGKNGNDVLVAGLGRDRADGGAGKDLFLIDGGVQDLRGGAGADTFRFTEEVYFDSSNPIEVSVRGGAGADRLVLNGNDRGLVVFQDFVSGVDKIDLRGSFGATRTLENVFASLEHTDDVPEDFGVSGVYVDLNTAMDLVIAGLTPDDLLITD